MTVTTITMATPTTATRAASTSSTANASATTATPPPHHRDTICLSDSEILAQSRHPGDQFILRLRAPEAARMARSGSFAHIQCDADIPLRRPLSIMAANSKEGSLEFLYRPLGPGLRALSRKKPGDRVSVLAPIGNGFSFDPARPRVVAIGGGVGIPPMLMLAADLAADGRFLPLVLMGSEVPFPFELAAPQPSEAWPDATTAALARLEAIDVPSRLASNAGLAGAYAGYVTDLAKQELKRLGPGARHEVSLYACGPEPMLKAAAKLAVEFDVPCQIAVEEFMACGIGGCAGCTLQIKTPSGPAMKRVCVDGPVFDSRAVY
jgi:dihydroorotate dehydrogenase electron transfer subunit